MWGLIFEETFHIYDTTILANFQLLICIAMRKKCLRTFNSISPFHRVQSQFFLSSRGEDIKK